jgi:hypothetical protein
LLEHYFLPGDLEKQIESFVDHYKHQEIIERQIKRMEESGLDNRSTAPLKRQLAGIKKGRESQHQEVFAGAYSRPQPEQQNSPSEPTPDDLELMDKELEESILSGALRASKRFAFVEPVIPAFGVQRSATSSPNYRGRLEEYDIRQSR